MKCTNSGRFLNEQTYLNTVCKSRCRPPKKMKPKDDCYLECCCDTGFGKLTVRCDRHSTGICLDIDRGRHCDKHKD